MAQLEEISLQSREAQNQILRTKKEGLYNLEQALVGKGISNFTFF
jgi:hypothetical protein